MAAHVPKFRPNFGLTKGARSRSIGDRLRHLWAQLRRTNEPAKSAEYLTWRRRFFHQRLGAGLWIGLVYVLVLFSYWLYIFIFQIEKLRSDFDKIFAKPWLADQFRAITVIACFVVLGLILICLLIHKTQWGRRHPAIIFFIFTGAVNGLVTLLIGTFYGIPIQPNPIVFLAFAVLIPICWRLHLLSQLLPITYYTIALPLLGMTDIGDESIVNIYSLGDLIELVWVCIICNLGVFVYERLRLSEFESRRELQIFLHAISHDLRNPVMGTSIVVKGLLDKVANGYTKISAPVLERLLQGSDRQIALINALVEAYHADAQGLTLHCQPLQLSHVVDTALADITPKLIQDKVQLKNLIDPNLPLVNADQTHLWRVFSNLIDNALKHNPPGIQLTLDAEIIQDTHLLCRVQDNGVGISQDQCERLFELYTRGKQARYMPGLGLGLYLCKQIVTAHGGDIGVTSQPAIGSMFWFTLPLATLTY